MKDKWHLIHRERQALVSELAGIPSEAWETPSLCPGWDVHDVLAHLVNDARTTWGRFAWDFARARFDFDRMNAQGIARERSSSPKVTLNVFRAVSGRSTGAPAPFPTRLVELFVHGEDIRRPLGISHEYPLPELGEALSYQLSTTADFGGGRERAEGLSLEATDSGLRHGSGPTVRGSSLALLLAVSGRPVDPGELAGPGAEGFPVRNLSD
ncbi:maleylpyruvate isomerase family mycothiol-dependent enzyme [Arthrobacter sp. NPDC090010]|uniref:maleylpyruvate isomerase family mycothiol-dependent enzyme n=1 Tax=Arthrobacter sp. NPDC090010 TaxID=3363942 RepID=UPI0037F8D577